MPSATRLVRTVLDRRLPLRTRLALVAVDLRRRIAPRPLYRVRYGRGSVCLTESDFAVDRASFDFAVREGSYATDYRDAHVVDLGAHKGYFGAYASVHGARAVVAYEPERGNLDVLKPTAAAYRGPGVTWTVYAAAVDARAGTADLHVMGASWGHALAPPPEFAEHEVGVEAVAVVALADVLAGAVALAGGGRVVVKINIEGAECSAVLGTPPAAWNEVDELLVETHPWASCDATALAAHLEPAGLSRAESSHPAVLRMRREAHLRSGRRTETT
jgi:FkbM family methyltransferase